MTWVELEKCFHRAISQAFSKKKAILAFPALILCGILLVSCKAIAFDASDWVAMSLAFLPILLSSGILLSLGVLLIRLYAHEAKQLSLPFKKLFAGSADVILGTLYLSLPPILIYLLLWIVLGFFYLLREIPGVGQFFSIVFAFGPFLLILSSLLLCLFNLLLLFFVTPAVAMQPMKKVSAVQRIAAFLQGRLFTGVALFLLALIPIGFAVGLLSFSAFLTNMSFQVGEQSLAVALEWFFIMLPFCALLTPAVIFFFNFAAESFWLLQRRAATS